MKKLKIKKILVPVDFSEMSIQAIKAANELARRFGADVHLIHVFDEYFPAGFAPMPFPGPTPPLDWPVAITAKLKAARGKELSDLAMQFGISSRNVYLCDGSPAFDEICRVARDRRIDLIVMPTHGRTGMTHVLLGSTAERVVQHSPCPVFVCRKTPVRVNTILVPVDFSVASLHALKEAIALADRLAAKVVVFHAIPLDIADGYATYNLSTIIEGWTRAAKVEMRSLIRDAKFGNVKFETHFRVGSPADQACYFADKEKIDLIVTGTHGRTGFKHLLMGSVAENIVRHASCSVFVVPTHPEMRMKRISKMPKKSRPVFRPSMRRNLVGSAKLTKRSRKIARQPFPERRKTNKFRQPHRLVSAR